MHINQLEGRLSSPARLELKTARSTTRINVNGSKNGEECEHQYREPVAVLCHQISVQAAASNHERQNRLMHDVNPTAVNARNQQFNAGSVI